MENKSFSGVDVNEDLGQVEAVFSTFNVVDKDGDMTVPGAIKHGTEVLISAYAHALWDGVMPVGKGFVHVDGKEAVLKGSFFLDTAAGRDAFNVVKNVGASQQWSFGFNIKDYETKYLNGENVRVLKSLDVFEVSPVFIGAGVNTRTRLAKTAVHEGISAPRKELISEHVRFIKNSLPM